MKHLEFLKLELGTRVYPIPERIGSNYHDLRNVGVYGCC